MKIFLVLAISFLSFNVSGQSKFITIRGKEVIGLDGKPFLIRGTNLGNWLVPEGYMFRFKNVNSERLINETLSELLGPDETRTFWKTFLENYITEEDIRFLKSTGMNSIRIPFHYKLFTDEDYMGGQGEARGFLLLDKAINWCRQHELYVILDMHCAPGGQTGDNIDDSWGYPYLFENKPSRELTKSIWKKIAAKYKDAAIILGYDLLNEPIAHFFDSSKLNPLLEPLYKEIVSEIRQVDKNHIILLGGAQWNSNFRVFGPPFDDKLIYTFHKYWTPATVDVIKDYINFRDKYNVPIYVGETGENKNEWVRDFRKVLEQNNIGWHFWPYKKLESKAGFVEFKYPPGYDSVIKYAETPKVNFEEIRKARPKNMDEIKAALNGFLINCQFKNCVPNKGYIEALGLKVK